MSESTTGTPALNKALAAVQASLPKIDKGQEGKVEGQTKDGRRFSYTYKYADLADLSEIVLPLLGKHGLAFTAMPGLNGTGQFGLDYRLLHESGEEKGGFYPISAGTPQQNGSAITYARRYCLGAVTGIAPAEDDDGAAANQAPRSAGDAWEAATPAAARQDGNGQGRPQRPARPPAQPQGDDPLLGSWAQKLDEITSQDEADEALAELDREHRGGVIDSRREGAIKRAIKQKAASLPGGSASPSGQPAQAAKGGEDEAWIADFKTRLSQAPENALTTMRREVGQAVMHRKITPDTSSTLTAAVNDRRRELEGASA